MKSRNQQFLDAIEAGDPSLLPLPITREERFLHALSTGEEITPTTFEEQFLQAARAFKGDSSSPLPSSGATNIFDLNYEKDTFLNTTAYTLDYFSGSGYNSAYAIVEEGSSYEITFHAPPSRFRTGFTTSLADRLLITPHGTSGILDHQGSLSATVTAPSGATILWIYCSDSGKYPALKIIEI